MMTVPFLVAAAAGHPATPLAAGAAARHPNVTPPVGVVVRAAGAWTVAAGGTVGKVLGGAARLLAAPDPR